MESIATPLEALKAAVARIGSQAATGRLLSVSQPTVWKWLQSSKRLPAEHVLAVEQATGISKHLLRPDIYPRPAALVPPPAEARVVEDGASIVSCDRGAGLKLGQGA